MPRLKQGQGDVFNSTSIRPIRGSGWVDDLTDTLSEFLEAIEYRDTKYLLEFYLYIRDVQIRIQVDDSRPQIIQHHDLKTNRYIEVMIFISPYTNALSPEDVEL